MLAARKDEEVRATKEDSIGMWRRTGTGSLRVEGTAVQTHPVNPIRSNATHYKLDTLSRKPSCVNEAMSNTRISLELSLA